MCLIQLLSFLISSHLFHSLYSNYYHMLMIIIIIQLRKRQSFDHTNLVIKKRKRDSACMCCTNQACPTCANLRNRSCCCENKQNLSCNNFSLTTFFAFYSVEMTLHFQNAFVRMKTQHIRERFFAWRKGRIGMEKQFKEEQHEKADLSGSDCADDRLPALRLRQLRQILGWQYVLR